MEYLLDTNHLSYLQERHPRVLERVAALFARDRLLAAAVSAAELLRGVYLLPEGRRRQPLAEEYHQVVRRMDEIVPITLSVAEAYAGIDVALRRKGRPIPVNDVWVAAAALTRDAVLVTNDDHFAHVDALVLENWTR